MFAASSVSEAPERINELLAGRAHPPRLSTHSGQYGWHLHVDSSDDAPWGEWFLTSSCLALAVLLAERQHLRVAIVRPAVREHRPGEHPAVPLGYVRDQGAGIGPPQAGMKG